MIYSARHAKAVRRIWRLDADDVRAALIAHLKTDRNFPFPTDAKHEDVEVEILDEPVRDGAGQQTRIVVTWHAEDDVRTAP
jgi:hypothetical protein